MCTYVSYLNVAGERGTPPEFRTPINSIPHKIAIFFGMVKNIETTNGARLRHQLFH